MTDELIPIFPICPICSSPCGPQQMKALNLLHLSALLFRGWDPDRYRRQKAFLFSCHDSTLRGDCCGSN